MSYLKGLIYIRDNELCRLKNIIKLGITSSLKNRNDSYITYEHEYGEFILVIEIDLDKMKTIDKYLKSYFKNFNNYKGMGTEYYDREIISLVEPYLQLMNINYKKLSEYEISFMERKEKLKSKKNYKIKTIFDNLNSREFINKLKTNNIKQKNKIINIEYKEPNYQQQIILNDIDIFYKINDIGKLIWACGLGKALLSILIVKKIEFKNVVIGVPSNYLQKQIKNEILKIFPNKNNILFVGGEKQDGIESTTNKNIIKEFIIKNNDYKFIITTYHSCYLLVDQDIQFDFKIGDEAHHLVGLEKEEERGFRLFHKIMSEKSLFMTATEKIIERKTYNNFSMDDETIFGKYIDNKSVYWAIENKKITDYNICVLKNTEDEVDEIINKLMIDVSNKELFISAFMTLKSFEKYRDLTHILLYTNTTEDAELSKKYIDYLLSYNETQYRKEKVMESLNSSCKNVSKLFSIRKQDIYNNALHSKNSSNLDIELNQFKTTRYGIISCVYIFGEGFDLPKLNGVCIAGNMQSEIRIVQYLLRPNRLEHGNPNKKAYVIIPYIDTDDWEKENKSYEKVRTIVSQMRNVDETIEQKIFLSTREKKMERENKRVEDGCRMIYYENYLFEENSNELNKIKLRLRYSKALGSKFTEEQDEYNYVKSINRSLNIQSKREYNEKEHIHSNFIKNPEEYFKAKGVWTDWYDFMGTDTSKFIQSKQEWINFCKGKKIKSLEDYNEKCDLYDILPKEPSDFYPHFSRISRELGFDCLRR